MATRMVVRAVLAVVALLFVIGVLVLAHIAAWYFLRFDAALPFYAATAIVGGIDLFIAIILGLFAARSTPSRVEREALAVRRQAVVGIKSFASLTQFALPALQMANTVRRRRSGRR